MIQLDPGEYFAIARQIDDPADTATYFVQAVVRNARTDAVIETVNLTDRGNQRFSKEWQVVQDVSGLGLYISITTTVYTDSGYSTKSSKYGIMVETHLVQRRQAPGGGGGGTVVGATPKEIRDAVGDALKEEDKLHKELIEKVDSAVSTMRELQEEIKELKSRALEPVDFSPVIERLPESVDLSQVTALLEQVQSSISDLPQETGIGEVIKAFKEEFDSFVNDNQIGLSKEDQKFIKKFFTAVKTLSEPNSNIEKLARSADDLSRWIQNMLLLRDKKPKSKKDFKGFPEL